MSTGREGRVAMMSLGRGRDCDWPARGENQDGRLGPGAGRKNRGGPRRGPLSQTRRRGRPWPSVALAREECRWKRAPGTEDLRGGCLLISVPPPPTPPLAPLPPHLPTDYTRIIPAARHLPTSRSARRPLHRPAIWRPLLRPRTRTPVRTAITGPKTSTPSSSSVTKKSAPPQSRHLPIVASPPLHRSASTPTRASSPPPTCLAPTSTSPPRTCPLTPTSTRSTPTAAPKASRPRCTMSTTSSRPTCTDSRPSPPPAPRP